MRKEFNRAIMAKKTKTIIFALCALVITACTEEPTPQQDEQMINIIYQSLDLTPEQFAKNMSKQGLHVISPDEKKQYSMAFGYTKEIVLFINYQDDVINQIAYNFNNLGKTNPAAYYKKISDIISAWGYTNWHGYYNNAAEIGNYIGVVVYREFTSAQTATDPTDLCNHIQNESLNDLETEQYYAETFTYTDNSQWDGFLVMYCMKDMTGGMDENDPIRYTKYTEFNFILNRIK